MFYGISALPKAGTAALEPPGFPSGISGYAPPNRIQPCFSLRALPKYKKCRRELPVIPLTYTPMGYIMIIPCRGMEGECDND